MVNPRKTPRQQAARTRKLNTHLHFLQVQGLWSVSAMMAGPGGELSSANVPLLRLEMRDTGCTAIPLMTKNTHIVKQTPKYQEIYRKTRRHKGRESEKREGRTDGPIDQQTGRHIEKQTQTGVSVCATNMWRAIRLYYHARDRGTAGGRRGAGRAPPPRRRTA